MYCWCCFRQHTNRIKRCAPWKLFVQVHTRTIVYLSFPCIFPCMPHIHNKRCSFAKIPLALLTLTDGCIFDWMVVSSSTSGVGKIKYSSKTKINTKISLHFKITAFSSASSSFSSSSFVLKGGTLYM